MKKLFVVGLAALLVLLPAPSIADAQELTLAQIVELFISLDIIPADKAAQAREAVQNIGSGQSTSGSAGSGGSCYSVSVSRWLTVGVSGSDVTALQTFLARFPNWYPEGEVTGYFGRLTELAVQRYQKEKKIASSGTAASSGYGATGPKTRSSLAACHTWTGAASPNASPTDSTIIVPTASAVYPLNQLGHISINLGQGDNIATQARFYILGGEYKKWELIGTEQFNHRPSSITHTFTPQTLPKLVPDIAYAILVSVDQWEVSKYVNKENVYLDTPLFFSKGTDSPIYANTTILNSSVITTPARGSVFSLAQPAQISVRLKSLSNNAATRARYYLIGGLLGTKNWKEIGTTQSIFRPTDMSLAYTPSAVMYFPDSRSTTTAQALQNGVPYSVLVSVDEWVTDKYVNTENIYLDTPLYFSDNVQHGIRFAPARGLTADDTRWQVFNELRQTSTEGEISVDAYDMNGDGVKEVFGYTRKASLCRSGRCPLSLYRRFGSADNGYYWQSFFFGGNLKYTLAPESVMVLNTTSGGWKDIAILADDGQYDVWRWNGASYELDYKVVSLLPGLMEISTAPTSQGATAESTTNTSSGTTHSGTTNSSSGSSGSSAPPPPPPPPAL